MKKRNMRLFNSVRGMTVAAMLVALSVLVGIFCKTYLNFGMGLFRVTFENLPIIMAGVLYGPIVGGLVGVCSDLVSYLFSNQAYPPNLWVTLGALAVGVVSGITSRLVIKRKCYGQIIISGAAAHVVGSMIIKTIGLYSYYGIAVLVRVPLYLVIASLEILVLCLILGRRSFGRVVGYQMDSERKWL